MEKTSPYRVPHEDPTETPASFLHEVLLAPLPLLRGTLAVLLFFLVVGGPVAGLLATTYAFSYFNYTHQYVRIAQSALAFILQLQVWGVGLALWEHCATPYAGEVTPRTCTAAVVVAGSHGAGDPGVLPVVPGMRTWGMILSFVTSP